MKAKAWMCWLIVTFAMALSGTAKAQVSTNCNHPDPNNFDQVYACMSSTHFGNENGPNYFAPGLLNTPCQSLAMKYAAVMQRAGSRREEAIELVPSCQMFAKVGKAMAGKPPFWMSCTDYPGHFDPEHMKTCLTGFLAGYRRMTLDRLGGCQDAVGQYEQALQTATIIKGRTITHGLPEGYSRPTCQQVAAVIGNKGAECQAYAPTVEHVRQCLGQSADRITDCQSLRQNYETRLRQAYSGMPPGYQPLTCEQLNPVLAEAKRRYDRISRPTPARPQPVYHAPVAWNQFGGLGDWFKLVMIGMGGGWATWAVSLLGLPFILSFVVHGVLEVWILVRGLKKHETPAPGGVVDMILRSFGLGSVLRHGPAFAAGTWFFGLLWVPGAALAIIIGRLIALGFWTRGAFKRGSGPAKE